MPVTAGRDTRRAPARDVVRLLALGRAELDALFAGLEAGPVPDGEYRGTLIAPLSRFCQGSCQRACLASQGAAGRHRDQRGWGLGWTACAAARRR